MEKPTRFAPRREVLADIEAREIATRDIAIPLNDVFKDEFVSHIDPVFRADFKASHQWAPEHRGKPGLDELKMIYKNRDK